MPTLPPLTLVKLTQEQKSILSAERKLEMLTAELCNALRLRSIIIREEAHALHSDMEAVVERLTWYGTAAKVSDIRTATWYRVSTEVSGLQERLQRLEHLSADPTMSAKQRLDSFYADTLSELRRRASLLQREAKTLHSDMETISERLTWHGPAARVSDIKTATWYRVSTEFNLLQEVLLYHDSLLKDAPSAIPGPHVDDEEDLLYPQHDAQRIPAPRAAD